MSNDIIIIEDKKIRKIIKIDSLSIFIKSFVLFFSIALYIMFNEYLIIIYGILSFILLLIASNFLSYFIKNKIKIHEDTIKKLFYTEIRYSPTQYLEVISDLLSSAILSTILNLGLFILFYQYFNNSLSLLLLIIFLITPFILLIYFVIIPSLKESMYDSRIEREMPAATMLITALNSCNINPYTSLQVLSKSYFFKEFRRIFKLIEKMRVLMVLNPIDAIFQFSKTVRQENLKKLLQTMAAVTLGSNTGSLLKEHMKETYYLFEKKVEGFVEKFNIILAAKLLSFILFPIITMLIVTFTQIQNISILYLSLYLLPLIFFIVLYLMSQNLIPLSMKISVKINTKSLLVLSTMPVYIVLAYLGLIRPHLAFLLSASTFFLGYYLLNKRNLINAEKLLNELPQIVSDIAEESKKGKGLYQAIEEIKDRYDSSKILLKKITFLKKLGFSMEEILKKENIPNFFKQILIVLEESDKAGIDPSVVKDLSEFTERLERIRKAFKLRIRFFKFASYLLTALLGLSLGITVNIITNLLSIFKTIQEASYYSLGFFNTSIDVAMFKEITYSSGILNSFLLGFLGGSADSNTVEASKNALICLLLYSLTLYLTETLGFFIIA